MEIRFTDNWNKYLELIPTEKQDIYFTEEYVKLYQNNIDKALCVVAIDDEKIVLMPILRRQIDEAKFDFETPYGYGGFISNSEDKEFLNRAMDQIKIEFTNNNYVAGFIRFHPIIENSEICRGHLQIIEDRKTIAMDLRPSEQDIWSQQVHTKNRNTIKKAIKNGLEFIADHDFKFFDDFIRLYNATMDKLNADDFYYFGKNYYEQWYRTLKDKSFIAAVKYEDRIISACIIMNDSQYGHYHLSGSDKEYLRLEPNNFMLWNAAMHLKEMGIKKFHLGGGTDSNPENSLFKFKSRLSTEKYQFSFGKLIFNTEIYESLCKNWESKNPDKVEKFKYHLLKYRY